MGKEEIMQGKRPRRLWIGLSIVAVVCLIGIAASRIGLDRGEVADAPLDPITFQLSWAHNGAYAGYYAADQRGYYKDEGLEISFLQGGPRIDPTASVAEGRAQFGAANANLLIKARAEGKPIRAIAALHRRVPIVFMTLKGSGIIHPRQFAGKTIHVSVQNLPILRAVASHVGVTPDHYKISHDADFEAFYRGDIDVYIGFLFDTSEIIREAGHEINQIHASDFGVHYYNNCIFTTDEIIESRPDLVSRFLRSTLTQGWDYALRHVESAGPAVVKYNPDADPRREIAFLTAMLPVINTGEDEVGWMEPEVWSDMVANQIRMGLVPEPFNAREVYTTRFLDEIYETK